MYGDSPRLLHLITESIGGTCYVCVTVYYGAARNFTLH